MERLHSKKETREWRSLDAIDQFDRCGFIDDICLANIYLVAAHNYKKEHGDYGLPNAVVTNATKLISSRLSVAEGMGIDFGELGAIVKLRMIDKLSILIEKDV